MRYYKLNPDHSTAPTSMQEWARKFESSKDRRVARTELGTVPGLVTVSTIFLGLDHGWDEGGPPILFETMIIGGPLDESQERYSTWDEAVAGHGRWVDKARQRFPRWSNGFMKRAACRVVTPPLVTTRAGWAGPALKPATNLDNNI